MQDLTGQLRAIAVECPKARRSKLDQARQLTELIHEHKKLNISREEFKAYQAEIIGIRRTKGQTHDPVGPNEKGPNGHRIGYTPRMRPSRLRARGFCGQLIAEKGRMGWQKASGYNARARAEATVGRFKRVIGDGLRSRTDERRATEMDVAVQVLNRMLELGRPNYVRTA